LNEGKWETGNLIFLQSLKPGSYKINCEARDFETSLLYQKNILFTISKPFWLTFWFNALLTLVVIIAIFGFLKVYFSRQRKQQEERNGINNELNDLRIKSLQSQMNPHFIFNSLNSIQNFILSNKSKEAIIYLGSLGKLIRGNLDNVSEEFITLYEEIDFLKNYINIEKLRFKRKVKIELNNHIPDLNLLITPMLIQPLIENAIKHGIAPKASGGKISVNLNLNENLIIVTVQDDGVGRKNKNNTTKHNSKGLDLIQKRIDLLNSKYKTTNNSINLIDLENEGNPVGTQVILKLATHKFN
jgi:LytS/YehU family sensor histidine kinase